MRLSSKQVSSDGLDWSQTLLQADQSKPPSLRRQQQQNQPQSDPLKCPRCESTNTKFCYYNNYNKSQPRHFCKTCKRHWTKGGTLRNVPVGGGRKNKRDKTSKTSGSGTNTTSTSTSTTAPNTNSSDRVIRRPVNPHMAIQAQQQNQNLALALGDQKNISEILYQTMVDSPSSVLQQNSISCNNLDTKSLINTNNSGVVLDSSLSLPQNHGLLFPYSCSLDTHPSSVLCTSFHSSNSYSYIGETMENSTNTPSTSSRITQPWQVLNHTSSGMDMANYWNWDDREIFVSSDRNVPWDDSDIKPGI